MNNTTLKNKIDTLEYEYIKVCNSLAEIKSDSVVSIPKLIVRKKAIIEIYAFIRDYSDEYSEVELELKYKASKKPQYKVHKDLEITKILCCGTKTRIPYSLSNIAFGFCENMRRTKFPHLKNIGTEDQIRAVKEIIKTAPLLGDEICKALNESNIGYTNWKVASETLNIITLRSEDSLGNQTDLIICLTEKGE